MTMEMQKKPNLLGKCLGWLKKLTKRGSASCPSNPTSPGEKSWTSQPRQKVEDSTRA
jgi:hypothetical protein